MSTLEPAVWGLVGTIVGAAASIGTAWVAARSSSELQSKRALEDRKERANAFKRQTLLDVQEAVHDALRLASRAHLEDMKAFRSTGQWGRNMLTDDLAEELRLAHRRVAILVERVADDQLRASVTSMMRTVYKASQARDIDDAKAHMAAGINEALTTLESVGSVLRRHLEA